ncbi:hypothetical protein NDU88_007983 [Pleurodeles waltl]|uniref:Uncharacterized protein n=1 Tax=Pleurodeles waltl TaxID=8319 RepID=A0AAV7PQU2_PLEWA|nr:hypothetical protein NDU88_007983 [Pleurodeles waltl]
MFQTLWHRQPARAPRREAQTTRSAPRTVRNIDPSAPPGPRIHSLPGTFSTPRVGARGPPLALPQRIAWVPRGLPWHLLSPHRRAPGSSSPKCQVDLRWHHRTSWHGRAGAGAKRTTEALPHLSVCVLRSPPWLFLTSSAGAYREALSPALPRLLGPARHLLTSRCGYSQDLPSTS